MNKSDIKLSTLLMALLFYSFFIACNTEIKNVDDLKQKIQNQLKPLDGTFSVAYKSIGSSIGQEDMILIGAFERFHAASTMKTPVLIELYKQEEEGRFSVRDSVEVINEFTSIADGSKFTMEVDEHSEPYLFNKIGSKVTLYDLAYHMITESSNFATNILIEILDAKRITRSMRLLGAEKIEVLRGVEDLKAFDLDMNNITTSADLMVIFDALASDTLISKQANTEMIEILKDQKHNDMFPAKLPKETVVAHKTGWITGVNHDSGIIYLPDGNRFVLVFLSKETTDRAKVLDAAANIARLVYDYELNKKRE